MTIKRLKSHISEVNKPKRTPSHPTKSHVVLAKQGDGFKLIRFGCREQKQNHQEKAKVTQIRQNAKF